MSNHRLQILMRTGRGERLLPGTKQKLLKVEIAGVDRQNPSEGSPSWEKVS